MKIPKIIAFAAICQFIGLACGDEVRVSYMDTDIKAFRDKHPLHAEITRKDGKIHLSLTNVSKKHVTITKAPYSFHGHYEAADGSKLDEFGGATDAGTIEFSDHAVLRSKTKKDGEDVIDWSSWEIWETGASHKSASFLVFDLNLGGYFPEAGKYVSFKVSGRLGMSKDSGEQAGAGQPATRPESKSEGGDKPQPEAEGRSR